MSKKLENAVRLILGLNEEQLDELISELQAVPEYVPPETYYAAVGGVPPEGSAPRSATLHGVGAEVFPLDWEDEDTLVENVAFMDTVVLHTPL